MKNKAYTVSKIILTISLITFILMPLLVLLTNINQGDFQKIISAPMFWPMIGNSVLTTSIATVLSVTLAFILAWILNRTSIRFRAVFAILFTLPMLIPSISHGMGLVLLFGDNGIITNIFGIHIHLYGYTGIIIGSLLYSFPVAFLMLSDSFQYEDFTIYEAAKVLGLNKFQQFKLITFPNIKGTLISVIFAVFTMIFTDYGVPLMVGGKIITLPLYMYREVIGLLNYSKGAIIGVFLLLPAIIAFILDLKNSDGNNTTTLSKKYIITKNKKRDRVAYVICICVVILVSLPIFAFAYLSLVSKYPIDMSFSLSNIATAFHDLGIGYYIRNSLLLSFMSATIGMSMTYFIAYITARSKHSFSSMFLHFIAMASLAIPGIVLGLGYVLFFKGSFLQGGLAILILVNIAHFFTSPYLLAYNSLKKFNRNLEDTAETIGMSKIRMLLDVYIPCTQETIIEMFSYLFVNTMVTISAISFLANFKNMSLALLIPQLDAQSLIGITAFVSIIILMINSIMKIIIYFIQRHFRKKQWRRNL